MLVLVLVLVLVLIVLVLLVLVLPDAGAVARLPVSPLISLLLLLWHSCT